jgi:hypothetical protein
MQLQYMLCPAHALLLLLLLQHLTGALAANVTGMPYSILLTSLVRVVLELRSALTSGLNTPAGGGWDGVGAREVEGRGARRLWAAPGGVLRCRLSVHTLLRSGLCCAGLKCPCVRQGWYYQMTFHA